VVETITGSYPRDNLQSLDASYQGGARKRGEVNLFREKGSTHNEEQDTGGEKDKFCPQGKRLGY